MKKIIITIIVLAILVASGYYFWNKRHDYFFQGKMKNIEQKESEQNSNKNSAQNQTEIQVSEEGNIQSEEQSNELDVYANNYSEKPYKQILQEDCKRNCLNKKGTSDYQYCLEICGLSEDNPGNMGNGEDSQEPANTEKASSNCDELNGFEKDVCFKRRAVAEKNDDICENISDRNLKESCQDRVLEEIMEEWQTEPL